MRELGVLPAIPLVRPTTAVEASSNDPSNRADGRKADQHRPLKLRTGVVTSASGSALLELAHTKVLCSVFGPHATDGRDFSEQGRLQCSLRFASFARRGRERQLHGGSAEEKALSNELSAALSASVQLHRLPKSTIAVHVLVLQDDGGALPAAISCASLALADASIVLYDLVSACSCVMLGDAKTPCLDGTASEDVGAGGRTLIACMPTLDQLTLIRHEGRMSAECMSDSIQLALRGCATLHRHMTAALRASDATEAADAPQDATDEPVAEADEPNADDAAPAAEAPPAEEPNAPRSKKPRVRGK